MPGVRDELVRLVDAERACCAFAEWTVTSVAGRPILQATADPGALAPIAALFGAAPASAGD